MQAHVCALTMIPSRLSLSKKSLLNIQQRTAYKKASTWVGHTHLFQPLGPISPPKSNTKTVPATQPISYPPIQPLTSKPSVVLPKPKTQITTLPNNLRVCSEELYQQICFLGLYVQAGSRYEPKEKPGVSALLERLAWKGTAKKSAAELAISLDKLGAHVSSIQERDFVIYQVEGLRENMPQLLELMAESVTMPKYDIEDLQEIAAIAEIELADIKERPLDYLTELLHHVAFQGDPLGNDFFNFYENAQSITLEDVYAFMKTHYVGSKMVLGGASVNHEKFIAAATEAFGNIPKGLPETPIAKYTGGVHKVPHYSPEGEGFYAIGFPSGGWASCAERIALLQKILGGGKSFSSGGPGKGMFTRMYKGVLSQSSSFYSAECFASVRADSGLFAIHGSCPEEELPRLQQYITQELSRLLTEPIPPNELARAKAQLKTSIFYNLESRAVLCEDISRQVAIFQNKRDHPETSCAKIDAITADDLYDTIRELLQQRPSIVVMASPPALQRFPDAAVEQYFSYLTQQ